jgi:REP element-mobilizing transposase RayT
MRRARWLTPWKDSPEKPAIYHCISRVVDRRFVLGDDEREKFRTFMRMQEKFSGCRVLSYCVMSNHFHLLLEVPPMPEGGLSDAELLQRLAATSSEAFVAEVARELAEARKTVAEGRGEEAVLVGRIHARFTYRMHNLSEFMKALLIRFTRWFNRRHERCGTLWEERFKSVIVESGTAARTVAAYIDLNPVRAGLVDDPADYRWSGYGEAVGGCVKGDSLTRSGARGNWKKAREGLVRACLCDQGIGFDSGKWPEVSRIYRRLMGMALGRKKGASDAKGRGLVTKNTAELLESPDNETALPDPGMAAMLRHRIRYFTDGAVIGGRGFVNEVFAAARERFSAKRGDGARRLRGNAKAAGGVLWSARDLRLRI